MPAEVIAAHWHHKRGEPMYQLRIAGQRPSKRYWNGDFEPSPRS